MVTWSIAEFISPLFAKYLNKALVLLPTTYGHGLSNGSPASIQNFDHYQQVLMAVYQYVKHADQLPKPWVGIGQSTGGAIWMHHLLEYAEKDKTRSSIGFYCFLH